MQSIPAGAENSARYHQAMKARSKNMTPQAIELVARRFRVLGEPARLAILNALMKGELSVNGLVEATGLSQANVSKHLALLADSGFVSRRRKGLFAIYRIADASLFKLCDLMCSSIARRLGEDLREVS